MVGGPGLTPTRIAVAGDWHGDSVWAASVIISAAKILRETEERPLIVQLGDFGIWPGMDGACYLRDVEHVLHAEGAGLWFVDGNHEDFTQFAKFRKAGDGRARVGRSGRVWHLPRGHRWEWHGRTWLACGGGVSLDRAGRTEGVSWWPEEEITAEQEAAITGGGQVDVLVSHDCPAGVRHAFPPPPSWWALRDLARSDAHRERLQRIVDATQPAHVLHGHLHRPYRRVCDFGYGDVRVTGLDCNRGTGSNWAILNVKTMEWEVS